MGQQDYYALEALAVDHASGKLYGIGGQFFDNGSWYVKVFDTLTNKELTNAYVNIWPRNGSNASMITLHAAEFTSKVYLNKAENKARFRFKTTHIPSLFRIHVQERFIEHKDSIRTQRYPIVYEVGGDKIPLNFYTSDAVGPDYDFQAACKDMLRGSRDIIINVDAATEEEAKEWIKNSKGYGGDIGAITIDESKPIRAIRCPNMHVDAKGTIVCGQALGERGYGGEHGDGCIIGGYVEGPNCPEVAGVQ